MSSLIDGVECEIRSVKVQRSLHTVFKAIQRHPRDWRRLCRRVQRVVWHPDPSQGTFAEWIIDPEDEGRLRTETERNPRLWGRQGSEEYLALGWIGLAPGAARYPASKLLSTLAHECGHAVTRYIDFAARERVSRDGEWASELCADMYAFRWGFEREIRASAPLRNLAHHAVLPGETLWCNGKAFRVDRRFFLRRAPRHDEDAGRSGLPTGPDIGSGSPVSTRTRTRNSARN